MDPACQFNISSKLLMETICQRDNLNAAYKHVVKNKGVSGIDNINISDFEHWLKNNKDKLIESLLDGSYKPSAVKGVYIPKPRNRGKRCIGILTVVDRFVQQAIFQIINTPIDETFSNYSFGFRKNRGALQAVQLAKSYIENGNHYVSDIDIEKFFDNVHHDQVMYRLAKIIKDKRVLKIIRRFLQAGMWKYGVFLEKEKGVYQGGPLSPLLSNSLLHEVDILLEKNGHNFCRYADDIKIYTKSQKAAERVLSNVQKYIKKHLKLNCNQKKTKACNVNFSEFLGYRIDDKSRVTAIKDNVEHLKYKVRKLTMRSKFIDLPKMIKEINQIIVGWTSYFRYDYRKEIYVDIDGLVRRRIRANILRRATVLREKGGPWINSIGCRCNLDFNKMHWSYSLSRTKGHFIIRNKWFKENGLKSVYDSKEKYRVG